MSLCLSPGCFMRSFCDSFPPAGCPPPLSFYFVIVTFHHQVDKQTVMWSCILIMLSNSFDAALKRPLLLRPSRAPEGGRTWRLARCRGCLWLSVVVLLSPFSLFGRSDLDRDFWNNNDSSTVQQRWSSYPPKEFVLNISPYAPYGDPRLTLK